MRKKLKSPFHQKPYENNASSAPRINVILFYEHRSNIIKGIYKVGQLKGLARLCSHKALRNVKGTTGGSADNQTGLSPSSVAPMGPFSVTQDELRLLIISNKICAKCLGLLRETEAHIYLRVFYTLLFIELKPGCVTE